MLISNLEPVNIVTNLVLTVTLVLPLNTENVLLVTLTPTVYTDKLVMLLYLFVSMNILFVEITTTSS
jgi:hypothetical protein